jgi:hypothetical protein
MPHSETIRSRPTLYRGVRMRSRLEADYARHLDRQCIEWEYEPKCFAGPDGQWLPDFRQGAATGPTSYTEIKPADDELPVRAQSVPILRKMSVAWLSEPHAFLALVFWRYGAYRAAMAFLGRPLTNGSHQWELLVLRGEVLPHFGFGPLVVSIEEP